MHLDPPPPSSLEKGTNGPLLIQLVTLPKLLASLIFIETPGNTMWIMSQVKKYNKITFRLEFFNLG